MRAQDCVLDDFKLTSFNSEYCEEDVLLTEIGYEVNLNQLELKGRNVYVVVVDSNNNYKLFVGNTFDLSGYKGIFKVRVLATYETYQDPNFQEKFGKLKNSISPDNCLEGLTVNFKQINIVEKPAPEEEIVFICNDQNSVFLEGKEYEINSDEKEIIIPKIKNQACIAEIKYLVKKVKPKYDLISENVEIDCKNRPSAILGIQTDEKYKYLWSSKNAKIISEEEKQINAKKGGIYKLQIFYGPSFSCSTTESFEVKQTVELPTFTISDIDVGCSGTREVEVDLKAENFTKLQWTGPEKFKSNKSKETLDKFGNYFIKIENKGCVIESEFSLTQSNTLENLEILSTSDRKTCEEDFTTFYINLSDIENNQDLKINWFDKNGKSLGNESFIYTDQREVKVKVVDQVSGCSKEVNKKIKVENESLDLKILDKEATIFCNPSTASIGYTVNSKADIEIIGLGTYNINEKQIVFKNAGKFKVRASFKGQCIQEEIVTIDKKIENFNARYQIEPISCSTTGSIKINNPETGLRTSWTGPNGYEVENTWIIDDLVNQGIYVLTVTNPSTKCVTPVPITLTLDNALVNSDYSRVKIKATNNGIIDCANKSIELSFDRSNCNNCDEYEWILPDGSTEINNTITAETGGIYKLRFKIPNCTEKVAIEQTVVANETVAKPSYVSQDLGCDDKPGLLIVRNYEEFEKYQIYPSDKNPDDYPPIPAERQIEFRDPNSYIINFIAANGCTVQGSFEIKNQKKDPKFSIQQENLLSCKEGDIKINIIDEEVKPTKISKIQASDLDGNIYKLEDKLSFTIPANTSSFSLLVENNLQCSVDTTFILQKSRPIQFELNSFEIQDCNDLKGLVLNNELDSSYSYEWKFPNGITKNTKQLSGNLVVGNYEVTVFDPSTECDSTFNFELLPNSFTKTFSIQSQYDEITCDHNRILLSLNSIGELNNVEWRKEEKLISQSDTIIVVESGNYIVSGTTIEGCKIAANKEIIDLTFAYKDSYESSFEQNCSGNIIIKPNQELEDYFKLTWYDENYKEIATGTELLWNKLGILNLRIYDERSGCRFTERVEIASNPVFGGLTINTKNKNCTDEFAIEIDNPINVSVEVLKKEGNNFVGINPASEELSAGTYQIKAEKETCIIDYEVELNDFTSLKVKIEPIGEIPFLICDRDSIVLSPIITNESPFTEYQWTKDGSSYDNISSILITEAGNYTLEVYDPPSKCIDEIEYKIKDWGEYNLEIDFPEAILPCFPNSSVLLNANVTNPLADTLEYSFDGGLSWNFESSYRVDDGGTYAVQVRDNFGCLGTKNTMVTHYEPLLIDADFSSNIIDLGAPYAFLINSNKSSDLQLSWTYDGQFDGCSGCNTVEIEGVTTLDPVLVYAMDNENCQDTLEVYLPLDKYETSLNLPNAIDFSLSDEDGSFYVANKKAIESIQRFVVYNRNGQQVINLENLNPDEPLLNREIWNKFQTVATIPNGVYFYRVNATDILGRPAVSIGELTILNELR